MEKRAIIIILCCAIGPAGAARSTCFMVFVFEKTDTNPPLNY
jgi:hypothetical protein